MWPSPMEEETKIARLGRLMARVHRTSLDMRGSNGSANCLMSMLILTGSRPGVM